MNRILHHRAVSRKVNDLILRLMVVLCCGLCCGISLNANAKPEDSAAVTWQLGESTLAQDALALAALPDNNAEHELLYRKSIHLSATEVVTKIEEVIYYPTASTVQNAGNRVVGYESDVDSLTITEAAVLLRTNELRRFDPASAIFKDTDTYDVFTDSREVVIALPGLAPGAKALLAYTRTTQRNGLQLPWASNNFPQVDYARRLVEVSLSWDKDVAKPVWHNAFEGFSCTESTRHLHCSATDISKAQEDKDISYYDVWPQLQISSVSSWDDVIENELAGVQAAIADTLLLDQIYDGLDESLSNPIAPLWEFSAAKIRYVSFSAGEHSVLPHKISKTITDLYGDCKDKSMVLLALLRKQGLKASAALVATNRYDPQILAVPSGNYFNHMVVCLQDDAGAVTRCLDPTDPYSSSLGTTRNIQGRVALLLAPNSKPFAIPVDTYRWAVNVDTTIAFDNKGGQLETIKRVYPSHYAGWLRSRLASKTPQERQEWLLENYHNSVSTSADPEITQEGLDNLESTITIITSASFKDVVNSEEDLRYREKLAWINDLMSTFEIENEHYYYDFPGVEVNAQYRFELPTGWSDLQVGPKIDLTTDYGLFTRENKVDGRAVEQTSTLKLPARRLQVDEFERFNKFLKAILATSTMSLNAKRSSK